MSVDPEKKREGGGRSRWTLGGPYHVFPHLHNEKDGEGYEKRLLKVLEARCVPCREYGAAHEWQLETKLADRDVPGVGLEAEVENDLGNDGVYGAVEDPAFDREGDHGVREVGVVAEEDVGDKTVIATPVFWR